MADTGHFLWEIHGGSSTQGANDQIMPGGEKVHKVRLSPWQWPKVGR